MLLPAPEELLCCGCCNDVDNDETRTGEIDVVGGSGWGRFIPAKRIHFSKRHEEHIELAVDVQ
jgi:hypothetical protein